MHTSNQLPMHIKHFTGRQDPEIERARDMARCVMRTEDKTGSLMLSGLGGISKIK